MHCSDVMLAAQSDRHALMHVDAAETLAAQESGGGRVWRSGRSGARRRAVGLRARFCWKARAAGHVQRGARRERLGLGAVVVAAHGWATLKMSVEGLTQDLADVGVL